MGQPTSILCLNELQEMWIRRFRRRFLETREYEVNTDLADNDAIRLIDETPIAKKVIAIFVKPTLKIRIQYDKDGKQSLGTKFLCKEYGWSSEMVYRWSEQK